MGPGGAARASFLRRKANLVRDQHSVRGDQAIRTGRLRAVPDAFRPLRPRGGRVRVETRTLPTLGAKSISQRCAKGQPRDATRGSNSCNSASPSIGAATMPLLDEEEAAMTPYASDDEAAAASADAGAATEADAAAEAERRAKEEADAAAEAERRAKEEEERRRIEKQRLLKARAAEIVRKERMSKGDAAERFRETCRRSQEDLRRSRHSSVGSRPTTAPSQASSDHHLTDVGNKLGISPSEVREMRDVFDLIDKDGSGEIDFGEMQSLMRLVGMDSSEETVRVIMSEVDADGSGEVDFGEFCQTILRPTMSKYTVYEVQQAFEDLRRGLSHNHLDGSSRIHRDTLSSALRNFGPKLSRKEADQVCDDLNPEANGDIDYGTVLRMLDPGHVL